MKRAATRKPTRTPTQPATPRPKRAQPSVQRDHFNAWLAHHLDVLTSTLQQLLKTPVTTLMTAAVIGIALTLPTSLLLLLQNAQHISQDWGGSVQISLFLQPQVTDEQAHALARQLQQQHDFSNIRVITHDEAFAEYKALSGFGEALQALEQNPLPAVLVLNPQFDITDPTYSEALLNQLQALEMVDIAQYDMLWLQRLFAMLKIVQRGVWILGFLLALAVLLIVGNTIRLSIYNKREEIEVTKLFGATDEFIRRPFLYTGLYYGLAGSLIAWILVSISFYLLVEPVKKLSNLYYVEYEMISLGFSSSLLLFLAGAILGLLGAWLSVGRHLKDIQPR
ncbi:permease-like cell division protein FtsX [Candidatus Albibeggiatoa sp. nov. NOAA]|uniref:permease-like cell division protein FtsX n=1 Tax=Candidatus Albibeggiatoa sp. nov. NOAA TaxID=3162724 RepID=UPI0032F9911B|nr:permease-like cell division protein FtsX [Thiotrichaceae bacterium]